MYYSPFVHTHTHTPSHATQISPSPDPHNLTARRWLPLSLSPFSFKVDGDTDSPTVQREFERIVRVNVERVLNSDRPDSTGDIPPVQIGTFKTVLQRSQRTDSMDAIVQDLDADMPGAVPTISHHVSLANGHLPGSGKVGVQPAKNGYVPNGRPNFRNMLEEADSYPIDSHI